MTVDNKKLLDTYTGKEFQSAKLGIKKGAVVYIQVKGYSDGSTYNPYLLFVKNTKSSSWESEINDTKKQANAIKANIKYYGNSYYGYPSASAEKDFFKFKSTKSGKLNVYYGSREMENSNCYFDLTVYVNSKEKVKSYSKDYLKKIKTIDVKKGDILYLIATSTESYRDYGLKVKYQ